MLTNRLPAIHLHRARAEGWHTNSTHSRPQTMLALVVWAVAAAVAVAASVAVAAVVMFALGCSW